MVLDEPMAGCGKHSLAEAETALAWDGLCPICLSSTRDEITNERDSLLDDNEALRFAATAASRGYQTLLHRLAELEQELEALKA